MAIACKCDRCGNLFELEGDRKVKRIHTCSVDISNGFESPQLLEKMDLCEDCYAELDVFLNKICEPIHDENVCQNLLTRLTNEEESK